MRSGSQQYSLSGWDVGSTAIKWHGNVCYLNSTQVYWQKVARWLKEIQYIKTNQLITCRIAVLCTKFWLLTNAVTKQDVLFLYLNRHRTRTLMVRSVLFVILAVNLTRMLCRKIKWTTFKSKELELTIITTTAECIITTVFCVHIFIGCHFGIINDDDDKSGLKGQL